MRRKARLKAELLTKALGSVILRKVTQPCENLRNLSHSTPRNLKK
jgi:hypothetical protein